MSAVSRPRPAVQARPRVSWRRPARLAVRYVLLVAILGAPNAGKSSLLNALAGREAAIVSARAGSTAAPA